VVEGSEVLKEMTMGRHNHYRQGDQRS